MAFGIAAGGVGGAGEGAFRFGGGATTRKGKVGCGEEGGDFDVGEVDGESGGYSEMAGGMFLLNIILFYS